MKQLLFFVAIFFLGVSIAKFADARMMQVISQHGNWTVQSNCTSVYALNSSASAFDTEGFRAVLDIGCDNGYRGRPKIRCKWYDGFKLHSKSQLKFKLADNDLTSDGWICEKNACWPEDDESAAEILEFLLAKEGPFVIIMTDKDKAMQTTIDTTGINGAYQSLLKHRR